jgi:hypothetical protein
MYLGKTSSHSLSGDPAPVAVFAFRRLEPLRRTLDALERCPEFEDSRVVVFSDAAREGQPGESESVAKVRNFLRDWTQRHGATLKEAPVNMGLRRSITSGVSEVVSEHDRVIVLEDDIIISPHFLRFMNEALEACRDREDIFQISGYFVPGKTPLPPLGLLRVPACWGWATWKRAWDAYDDDAAALLTKIDERGGVYQFNLNGSYDYYESLRANSVGQASTWMVRWYASLFLRGGLTLYPGKSLTRNIGFDDEGTHCGKGRLAQTFSRQSIARSLPGIDWTNLGTRESPEWFVALESFYRWQSEQWGKPSAGEIWRARWQRLRGRDWREKTRS